MPAAWDLVAAHERRRAADPERRKRDGAFYTPAALASAVARRALGPWLASGRSGLPRILDPAVGGGSFLLAAIDALVAAGVEPRTAAACCHGLDSDPGAIEVAREAVRLHARGGSAELRVADALLLPPEPRFDVILGNPPWEKIARADPRKAAFDARFAQIREGEINLLALFWAWSLHSLRPGGRAALLTPNTWLLNRWNERLRRFVLQHRLEEVTILPAGTFPATPITVPALVIATAGPPGGLTLVRAPGFASEADQACWLRRPHAAISVHDDARLAAVERRWAGLTVPLGDVAHASDGIYTSTARQFAFFAPGAGGRRPTLAPGPRDRPILLSGSELSRDLHVPAGAFIPEELWARHAAAQDRERLALHAARHPQLARRLVGAVVPAGLYTSNRFINVRSEAEDVHYLAAILLSRVLDGYHARRFPVADVDAFMLHQLPVPVADAAAKGRLARGARTRARLARNAHLALVCGGAAWPWIEAYRRADAAIEDEVARLLGLSPGEAAWLRAPRVDIAEVTAFQASRGTPKSLPVSGEV